MLSIIPARALALLSAAFLALFVFLAFSIGQATAMPSLPSDGSADAGFARDMQTHHDQAVEMSMLIRDRSTDPAVRTMAYDIALTQQQQSGQMFAWLREWGLDQTSTAAPMAWVSPAGGHTSGHHTVSAGTNDGIMPGMASAADMAKLRNASGKEADSLFLRLMIEHHRGGVTMAEAATKAARTDSVRALAQQLITSQASEITAMQQMLDS